VCAGVRVESTESCGVVQPLCIPSVIRPERCTPLVVVRWTDELLCGGQGFQVKYSIKKQTVLREVRKTPNRLF